MESVYLILPNVRVTGMCHQGTMLKRFALLNFLETPRKPFFPVARAQRIHCSQNILTHEGDAVTSSSASYLSGLLGRPGPAWPPAASHSTSLTRLLSTVFLCDFGGVHLPEAPWEMNSYRLWANL